MNYLASSNVKISYPNVERVDNGRSVVQSEQNIVNTVCSLTPDGKGTFILESSVGNNTDGFKIQFYIRGYYFDIVIPAGSNYADYVFSDITLAPPTDTSTVYADYKELQGTDEGGNYTGLKFNSTNPDNTMTQLLKQNGSQYEINDNLFVNNLWISKIKNELKPFFIDTEDPNTKSPENEQNSMDKIWIDSTNGYISRVYDSTSQTWIKLGAVYK